MEYFKDAIFDFPKKPLGAFIFYYKNNYAKFKMQNNNLEYR